MTQTLEIIPYESQAAEYDSYKACNIDFMDSPLTSNQIGELSTIDPFMSTYARAPYVEAGMFEFDLNNAKSPTNETVFRKALSMCFDKSSFVINRLSGFGKVLDSPIGCLEEWYNPYCSNLYPYNLTAAAEMLDASGYLDINGDGWREGPHGEEIPLIFYARADQPDRFNMSQTFKSNLELINLYVDFRTYPPIRNPIYEGNYNIYGGGWNYEGVRDPTFLYDAYGIPGQANYIRYSNLQFSEHGRALLNASEIGDEHTIGTAKYHVFAMQRIFMDDAALIPVFAYLRIGAYKTGWQKAVNAENEGPWCWFTMLNTWRQMPIEPIIRWGFSSDIYDVNPIHSEGWASDLNLLGLIYDPLIRYDPYDMTLDKPWMAKAWIPGNWTYQGQLASYVEFKLREDMYWHDVPAKPDRKTPNGIPFLTEGASNIPVTASDVAFTINCVKNIEEAWNHYLVEEVVYTEQLDPYTIRVYFGVYMPLWSLHKVGSLPIIPKHVWEPVYLEGTTSTFNAIDQKCLAGCGPWTFDYDASSLHNYYKLRAYARYFRYHPVDILIYHDQPYKKILPETTVHFEGFLHNQDFQRDPIAQDTFNIEINITYPNGTVQTKYDNGHPPLPACTEVSVYSFDLILERGLYEIKGTISYDAVTGHTDVDGYAEYIWCTMREDLNLDFYVNAKDAVALGNAFGSKPGDTKWNPAADINNDGFVNAKDAIKLGALFGWPS